jgi:hypothetical protein
LGLPAERRAASLGPRLVEMVAKQVKVRATVAAGRSDRGTALTVIFPDPNATPGCSG